MRPSGRQGKPCKRSTDCSRRRKRASSLCRSLLLRAKAKRDEPPASTAAVASNRVVDQADATARGAWEGAPCEHVLVSRGVDPLARSCGGPDRLPRKLGARGLSRRNGGAPAGAMGGDPPA